MMYPAILTSLISNGNLIETINFVKKNDLSINDKWVSFGINLCATIININLGGKQFQVLKVSWLPSPLNATQMIAQPL